MARSLLLVFLSLTRLTSHCVAWPSTDHDARDLLGLPIPDPLDIQHLVDNLRGSVSSTVDLNNKRPDAAHPYQAPGPTDQRGPCPGLNVLANHGYLNRTGIVHMDDVIQAVIDHLNMGPDVATFLAVTQIATAGNLETGMLSLGGEDDRTYSASGIGSKAAGRQYGLDAHSRIEVDASPTREDFFLNNGQVVDNHSGSPSRFARYVQLAGAHGGQFSAEASNALYNQNMRLSLANNPRLSASDFQFVGIMAVYLVIPYFFSNGTYEAGGVANYDSISSFLGYQFDSSTGKFCYVPERFPDNWYRRATPYTFADIFKHLPSTYLSGPLLATNPLSALLDPAELPQLECFLYQRIFEITPVSLIGSSVEKIAAASKYLQDNLAPFLPSTLGCPIYVSGNTTLQTQDSLQETGPGGGQAYNSCSA